MKERKRVCCNCENNIRIKNDKDIVVRCECAIDGHNIGYIECFEHWCRRWKKIESGIEVKVCDLNNLKLENLPC